MSEEEKYSVVSEAERVVWEKEKRYAINLKRVYDFFDNLWATSLGRMFVRERQIARRDLDAELERLNPADKWASENDQTPPKKKKRRRWHSGHEGYEGTEDGW